MKRYNLSLEEDNNGFLCKWKDVEQLQKENEELKVWIYKMGLKMDGIIPLKGYDNMERISLGLDMLKLNKGGEQ